VAVRPVQVRKWKIRDKPTREKGIKPAIGSSINYEIIRPLIPLGGKIDDRSTGGGYAKAGWTPPPGFDVPTR
jgi:hypothetical protein